jgi:glycosyltransferase involved in cell wall biosynthesis
MATPSIEKSILMLGEIDLQGGPNHRRHHIVKYFSSKFKSVDFVNYINLYDGPPARFSEKAIKSFENLAFRRVAIRQDGNLRMINVRKLKLPQTLKNLIGDLWAYCVLSELLKRRHYEVCICSGAHSAFFAKMLSRSNVVDRVFYDDYDFLPDGLDVRNRLDRAILAWRERVAITTADGVFSVSKALAELRKAQGAKNVIVVPNGVELDHFSAARNKVLHPPTLVYMGSLLESWGIDLVLKAMPLIRDKIPDIRFMILGGGEYERELARLTRDLNLDPNVAFLGKKPYSELPQLLREGDIGVSLYKRRRFTEFNCPQKILEYLAAGLPVVSSDFGEGRQIIEVSGAGEFTDDSPTSIASAILTIIGNRDEHERYVNKAIRYSENFDWNRILEPVVNLTVS